jgi:hypothetical protein
MGVVTRLRWASRERYAHLDEIVALTRFTTRFGELNRKERPDA